MFWTWGTTWAQILLNEIRKCILWIDVAVCKKKSCNSACLPALSWHTCPHGAINVEITKYQNIAWTEDFFQRICAIFIVWGRIKYYKRWAYFQAITTFLMTNSFGVAHNPVWSMIRGEILITKLPSAPQAKQNKARHITDHADLWIIWSKWPKHKHWNTARSKFFERWFPCNSDLKNDKKLSEGKVTVFQHFLEKRMLQILWTLCLTF